MFRSGIVTTAMSLLVLPALQSQAGAAAAAAAEQAARATPVVVPGPPWPTQKIVYDAHKEGYDQPPIWRSPIQSDVAAQGGPVVFGPYVSVQVNVDGMGNNIPGDAANEPSIAIDRTNPNRLAIGWRQFDTIASNFRQAGIAYSNDGGQTWTFPGVLQPGQFRSDPVLGSDASGNFFYSSLSSGTSAEMFRSADGGVNWAGPVNAFGGDKQWIAVDGRPAGTGAGYIAEFWNVQFSCCGSNDFARSINHALSFQSPIAIPLPSMKWGTMDVGPTGTLYLAGATLDQSGHLFSRSSNAWNTAVTPTFDFVNSINLDGLTGGFGGASGPNPVGLLGQVWVAAHPTQAGHVYVLGSVAPPTSDPMDVMFIRSTNDGQTWSSPVQVNDDPVGTNAWQWFGTMSVAPNGRIDVIFNDTRLSGQATMSAVFYTYSFDEGQTWAPNVQVSPIFNSHVGFPQQDKIGDYYHMISDNGGANLAYAATFNGEEDVYFLRITRDCNTNTIDDDCDITCGAPGTRCDVPGCGQSTDCDGNAVPDECEPDEDCNGNTIRDICEIGADPGLDCNLNQILDECESPEDCNSNGINDLCDLVNGSPDCNDNEVPDSCDIDDGTSLDRDGNGVPDECLGACCDCGGCSTETASTCAGNFGEFGGLGTICADPGVCEQGTPENDLCSTATNLPAQASFSVPFDNRCSSDDGPPTVNCPAGQPFGRDLWYRFLAPCTGTLRISMCAGTDFDAILAVYGGATTCTCPNNNTTLLTCGDDTCGVGGGPPTVDLSVTAGRCYLVRAGGWGGSLGTGALQFQYLTPCTPSSPLQSEPNGFDKNRFISFVVPSGLAGSQNALRVRLTSLHHPAEPPDAPDFSAFEGQYRYVNTYSVGPAAVLVCTDSQAQGTQFHCAHLGCSPEYRDWAADLGGEVVHVTGTEVVPSSLYHVALLPASCAGQEATCPDASAALQVPTALWGDVMPGSLDVLDIAETVDKVLEVAGALTEPRALLHFQEPQPRTESVNVIDVSDVTDAVKGYKYPYSIGPCP